MIRLSMPLSFMLQVQLQIRMKLTVLMLLLKIILLIILVIVVVTKMSKVEEKSVFRHHRPFNPMKNYEFSIFSIEFSSYTRHTLV